MEAEFRFKSRRLRVVASGPAWSIAERGEQLAWLSAALMLSPSPLMMSICRPTCKIALSHSGEKASRGPQYFEVGYDRVDKWITTSEMSRWQTTLRRPVLILLFPVLSRPDECEGLEVPSIDALLEYAEAENLTRTGGMTMILGLKSSLVLCSRESEVFVWRPMNGSEPTGDSCYCEVPEDTGLWRGRHVYSKAAVARPNERIPS